MRGCTASQPARSAREPRDALDRFGLDAVADALPDSPAAGHPPAPVAGRGLLHGPEILILDEPTSGVDPVARDSFWEHARRSGARDGVTIFVSTHFMNEAERCDRISLMHAGRMLAVDTPQEIREARGAASLEDAFIAYLEEATGGEEAAASAAAGAGPSRTAEARRPLRPRRASASAGSWPSRAAR